MHKITIELTEDQRDMIVQTLNTHYQSDTAIERRIPTNMELRDKVKKNQAFLRRTIDILARAKTL